jgi:sulfoxide reductase catalytic subunit YedY
VKSFAEKTSRKAASVRCLPAALQHAGAGCLETQKPSKPDENRFLFTTGSYMNSRREFIKKTFQAFALLEIISTPLFSMCGWALDRVQKIILPADTKRESLIQKNPADLDARHLPVTELSGFQTMGLTDHRVDLAGWRLEVEGMVEKPLSLSYQEVKDLPSVTENVLLICPGFFANHGRWRGLLVRDLITLAGYRKGATHVTIRGPKSSYEKTERYTLAQVLTERILLAYEVNGKTLPEKHGFPMRLVADGHYGWAWVKYVCRVTVEQIS